MACGKETTVPQMTRPSPTKSLEEQNHDQNWDAPDYVYEGAEMPNAQPVNNEVPKDTSPAKPVDKAKGRPCHIIVCENPVL